MNPALTPKKKLFGMLLSITWCSLASASTPNGFCRSELIFPLETWHNHASCIVEAPNGDLLACWFHGSGERTADDVIIEGARLKKGSKEWSQRFVLSDTPGFPDGNPCLYVDPSERLWLFHTVILANTWESALLKVKTSREYLRKGPPNWATSDVILMKPGLDFAEAVGRFLPQVQSHVAGLQLSDRERPEADEFVAAMSTGGTNKLYQRLGWMTRAHPLLLPQGRLLLPLYHDGFSFSLVGISDDWGRTWTASAPITGAGNIQPSIVRRRDGSLVALMRDNGPPPKRLLQSISTDAGKTWSVAFDSNLPNPGAGAEIITLRNGNWLLINNDTESGRHQLVVQISPDEGASWPWRRYLEQDPAGPDAGSYHYPSIIQAKDGTLHATYSYHLNKRSLPKDVDGDPAAKSIKHAHFDETWVMQTGTR